MLLACDELTVVELVSAVARVNAEAFGAIAVLALVVSVLANWGNREFGL
jgi:hypothetical protein